MAWAAAWLRIRTSCCRIEFLIVYGDCGAAGAGVGGRGADTDGALKAGALAGNPYAVCKRPLAEPPELLRVC